MPLSPEAKRRRRENQRLRQREPSLKRRNEFGIPDPTPADAVSLINGENIFENETRSNEERVNLLQIKTRGDRE